MFFHGDILFERDNPSKKFSLSLPSLSVFYYLHNNHHHQLLHHSRLEIDPVMKSVFYSEMNIEHVMDILGKIMVL